MSDYKCASDLIGGDNVVRTWNEGKYVCFLLTNGFVVKLNPNKAPVKGA